MPSTTGKSSGNAAWRSTITCDILNVPYYNGFFYAETQDDPPITSKVFRIDASTGKLDQVIDYGRAPVPAPPRSSRAAASSAATMPKTGPW